MFFATLKKGDMMKTLERFELLCEDEGFIKTVKGYSESNYSFDSYFKWTNFREVYVKKALKLKIWTREENKKYF